MDDDPGDNFPLNPKLPFFPKLFVKTQVRRWGIKLSINPISIKQQETRAEIQEFSMQEKFKIKSGKQLSGIFPVNHHALLKMYNNDNRNVKVKEKGRPVP